MDVCILLLFSVKIAFLPCPCCPTTLHATRLRLFRNASSRYLNVAKPLTAAGSCLYFVVRVICTSRLDQEKRGNISTLHRKDTDENKLCVCTSLIELDTRKTQMVEKEVLRKTADEKQRAGCEQCRILQDDGGLRYIYIYTLHLFL